MADPTQNGQQPSEEDMARQQMLAQMTAPRPVPTAWNMRVVPFVRADPDDPTKQERVQQVEMSLHSPTGVNISFWDVSSAKRLAADLRAHAAEAQQKQTGLWTPPPPGADLTG